MAQPGHLLLAVGGVFLVAWYGIGRLGSARGDRRFPKVSPGSEDFSRISRAAIAAEFHPAPTEMDDQDGFPGGTVYCPCGQEKFPAGVLYCSCGRETEEDPPPAAHDEDTFAPSDLVCIYVAENSWKAGLIRRLLRERHIPCTCTLSEPLHSGFDYTPLGEVPLYVPAGQATFAQSLLKKALWKA
ncbi:MAG: hypothetical protein JJU11_02530 [Candidatus Sumerlaeia bacterium]|nr:hypothetical protein [Candidatus Sumerlaeia bacterium]